MKRQPYKSEGEDFDRLTIRPPKRLAEEIRDIAHRRGLSINAALIEALEQYIQKEAGK